MKGLQRRGRTFGVRSLFRSGPSNRFLRKQLQKQQKKTTFVCHYKPNQPAMRNLLFLIAAALGALLPSCTPANRVVENPLIETANTRTLDIVKVELSDTATVLHMNAYYRPKNWIVISSDSYLQIPARKFMLTGAEGITPDSLFWMPKSGRASFVLRFPPLPRGTKSFDFIESDCDDCFKIYGVDLTGKTEYPEYPEGLPKELRKAPKDGPVPDPIFAVGETRVNIHLLGFREGMYKDMTLYINSMLTGHERKDAPIDPETGVATFKFGQYGPSLIYGNPAGPGSMHLNFWTAPGETADIYVDLTEKGKSIVQRRNNEQPKRAPLYSTGTYGALNTLFNGSETKTIALDTHTGEFADYRMTADEYVQMVASKYKLLADSIARSGMSSMMTELSLLSLQQETLNAFANSRFFLEHNYRSEHNMWDRNAKLDYEFAKLTSENQAMLCKLFDINNPKLPMGVRIFEYQRAALAPDIDWAQLVEATSPLADLRKVSSLPSKAENDALTEADLASLRSLKNPFYAEACEAIQARVRRELAALEGKVKIEETPDVAPDKLFDAIVAPYKGKVVLVDFWNTWCGPCQAAIKANEPLKTGELKSDDIVWIYLANETSPLVTYKTQIGKIAGKHYRLNEEQWKYLCEKFKVDGIPSYVLVDRDGNSKLRNDLRNHDKLKKTLKKMIE